MLNGKPFPTDSRGKLLARCVKCREIFDVEREPLIIDKCLRCASPEERRQYVEREALMRAANHRIAQRQEEAVQQAKQHAEKAKQHAEERQRNSGLLHELGRLESERVRIQFEERMSSLIPEIGPIRDAQDRRVRLMHCILMTLHGGSILESGDLHRIMVNTLIVDLACVKQALGAMEFLGWINRMGEDDAWQMSITGALILKSINANNRYSAKASKKAIAKAAKPRSEKPVVEAAPEAPVVKTKEPSPTPPKPKARKKEKPAEPKPLIVEADDTKIRQPVVPQLDVQEIKILGLIRHQSTESDIAQQVNLTVMTLRHRIKNLCGVLGVQSPDQAIVKAIEFNLLPKAPPMMPPFAELTKSELSFLAFVQKGYGGLEIAGAMMIGMPSVKSTLASIATKLGSSESMVEIELKAIKLGLIPPRQKPGRPKNSRPQVDDAPPGILSREELVFLSEVKDGKNPEQILKIMSITGSRMAGLMSTIPSKLCVDNIPEAISKAVELGLIKSDRMMGRANGSR